MQLLSQTDAQNSTENDDDLWRIGSYRTRVMLRWEGYTDAQVDTIFEFAKRIPAFTFRLRGEPGRGRFFDFRVAR